MTEKSEALTYRQKYFLRRMADLCEEFDVEIRYTNDDDGIHIDVEGDEVFVGYLFNPADELREAAGE